MLVEATDAPVGSSGRTPAPAASADDRRIDAPIPSPEPVSDDSTNRFSTTMSAAFPPRGGRPVTGPRIRPTRVGAP
ncbi:hypothetical protein GCM10009605_55950 [Nocardiopsis composta]